MKHAMKTGCIAVTLTLTAVVLLGCNPPDPTDPQVPDRVEPESVTPAASEEHGKPGAPVQVDYEVTGTPVVGQVTEIVLEFHTSIDDAPVYASYQPVDSSGLVLVDAAADRTAVSMQAEGEGRAGREQLRVIPQQEGRHFVNVLVEVETDAGPLVRSLSIPVEVAGLGANLQNDLPREPQQPPVETDSAGETVIPMPARERREE
jgi:hypothetical protein